MTQLASEKPRHYEAGLFIKCLRRQLPGEVSQERIAEKINYKNGQGVSNWERGLAAIPRKHLAVLADTLRTEPDKIIEKMGIDYRRHLQGGVTTGLIHIYMAGEKMTFDRTSKGDTRVT